MAAAMGRGKICMQYQQLKMLGEEATEEELSSGLAVR